MFLSVQNSQHLLLLWDSDPRLNSISEGMWVTTSYLLAMTVTGPGVSMRITKMLTSHQTCRRTRRHNITQYFLLLRAILRCVRIWQCAGASGVDTEPGPES